MHNVATRSNERWIEEGSDARVHFLPGYYSEDRWDRVAGLTRDALGVEVVSVHRLERGPGP